MFLGEIHRHCLHSSHFFLQYYRCPLLVFDTTRTCAYTYLRQIFLQPILNSKQVTKLTDFTSSHRCEICQVKCVCKQILTYQSKREAHSPKTLNIDSACHSMTLAKQHVLSEQKKPLVCWTWHASDTDGFTPYEIYPNLLNHQRSLLQKRPCGSLMDTSFIKSN